MRCLKDKEAFWYTFNFDKTVLDENFNQNDEYIFDRLVNEINDWSNCGDVKYYITADPLGDNLVSQIEKNLLAGNNACFSAVVYKNEILGVILSSYRENQPLKNYQFKINLNNVYIDDIIINPKHHNKGFGTRILNYFINNLEPITGFKKIDGIDSLITTSNDRSKNIFTKNKFISLKKSTNDPMQHFYFPMNKEIESLILFGDKNIKLGDKGK